jgi:hypothetical protein
MNDAPVRWSRPCKQHSRPGGTRQPVRCNGRSLLTLSDRSSDRLRAQSRLYAWCRACSHLPGLACRTGRSARICVSSPRYWICSATYFGEVGWRTALRARVEQLLKFEKTAYLLTHN